MTEIIQNNKVDSDNLRIQISLLTQQHSSAQQSFEKEQIISKHYEEENSKLKDQVSTFQSDISDLRQKLDSTQLSLTSLEKEKITLSMDIDRKDSSIQTLEETLRDLKQKSLADSSALQQLTIDHTKLQQVSLS